MRQVITYLQKEIRAARRNIGAVKLSNLLQLDRLEEDLNISRVSLKAQHSASTPKPTTLPRPDDQQHLTTLLQLKNLRDQLRHQS